MPEDRPVFDEQTLARVLEAAYVLQEYKRELELNLQLQSDRLRKQDAECVARSGRSQPGHKSSSSKNDDYTLILAQIVETHYQVRQLELKKALELITERLTQITAASGSGIGILADKVVRYEAASGPPALPIGGELPAEKALCFQSLRTGQILRCADVNPEFLLDAEECHRRGIQALIAVPFNYDGGIAGAVELYFDKANAFNVQDVHTCQLMAGLVSDAFARDAQPKPEEARKPEESVPADRVRERPFSFGGFVPEQVAEKSAPNRTPMYIGAVLAVLVIAAILIIGYWSIRERSASSHLVPQVASGATSEPTGKPAETPGIPSENSVAGVGQDRPDRPSGAKTDPQESAAPTETPSRAALYTRDPATKPDISAVTPNRGNGAEELLLAQQLLNGNQGKERDTTEAVKWLWQAVSKKNAAATLLLSDLYLKGDGVPKNCDQARILLSAAARNGAPGADERLRNLQSFGCAVDGNSVP